MIAFPCLCTGIRIYVQEGIESSANAKSSVDIDSKRNGQVDQKFVYDTCSVVSWSWLSPVQSGKRSPLRIVKAIPFMRLDGKARRIAVMFYKCNRPFGLEAIAYSSEKAIALLVSSR